MTESTHEPAHGPTAGSATEPAQPTEPTVPVAPYAFPSSAGAPQPLAAGVALADEPQPANPGGRRRTGVIVGALATVLVLGGAGVFAAQKLGGGGAQPADVLPGDAYAYLRLDIDPSAGQKIAAVRFLGKLPQVKDTLGSDDPRKKLWDLASKDANNACTAKLRYDTDIAPWLGDRVGAAFRPGGTADKPNVAVAIQVKDEAAAKDTLTKLFACDKSGSGTDLRMKDGYAIVTPSGVGDATLAAVDQGSLATNATFSGDMGALGEQGIMSAWFDMGSGLKEIQKLSGSTGMDTASIAGTKGRFAAALRFDADYVELSGVYRGADATTAVKGDGAELANLPDTTMAALQMSGGDQAIDAAWPQLKKQIDTLAATDGQPDVLAQIEQQFDVKLPADLKVLLGRSFTVAMPDQDLQGDSVTVGGKIVSSDAKRADEIIGHLAELAGGGSDVLTHGVEGDKVFVATTPAYVDALKAGGKLGDTDAFKLAVGDVSTSTSALFVDLDKVEKLYLGQVDGDQKAFLQSLRAVGINGRTTGAGEGTFTMRVVGN